MTSRNLNIGLASDHAGFHLKKCLLDYLVDQADYLGSRTVADHGTTHDQSVDYPDFVHPLVKGITEGNHDFGILICGSGNGVNMVANKYKNIRSALCWNPEIAKLARAHNNANVLALPARFITPEEAIEILKVFIETEFEGGRHQRRLEKF